MDRLGFQRQCEWGVRMSLVLGLALAAAQTTPEPWKRGWPANLAWAVQTADGDRFWIVQDELKREAANTFSVWLHGDSTGNKLVPYRTSLWRFHFWCNGTVELLASTKNFPDGKTENWDGPGQTTYIRPGTMYQDIENKFCQK